MENINITDMIIVIIITLLLARAVYVLVKQWKESDKKQAYSTKTSLWILGFIFLIITSSFAYGAYYCISQPEALITSGKYAGIHLWVAGVIFAEVGFIFLLMDLSFFVKLYYLRNIDLDDQN